MPQGKGSTDMWGVEGELYAVSVKWLTYTLPLTILRFRGVEHG
jgi:hypothetical protein